MTFAAGDAHPYPIYGGRFRVLFPILDADGDFVTGASTPDSEASIDCATFADCTNEATELATASGLYYLDLTATELTSSSTMIQVKTATSGAKSTPIVLYPKRLPIVRSGTAQAGAASTITLDSSASAVDSFYVGCWIQCSNNTPSNVQGQTRLITGYVGSTKVATVGAAWGTNPSSATTFDILAENTVNAAMLAGSAYNVTTAGSPNANVTQWNGTAVSSPATAGIPDVNVKNMNNVAATSITTINANVGTTQPTNFTGTSTSALVKSDMVDVAGAAVSTSSAQIGVNAVQLGGTAQAGRDIGTSVLLSSGTGAGQLDFTSGVVKSNLVQLIATALTETSGGLIAAAFKKFFDKATPTGTINSIPDAVAGAAGGLFIAGTNAATTVTTALTTTFAGNVTGSVGSVTGAVGSVTGAVGSVTGSVGSLTTNNDKTGYALSSGGVQAIWDALTSALTTSGSVGKWIVDKLDVVVSTRLATLSYTSPPSAATIAAAVWDYLASAATTVGSLGKRIVDNLTGDIYARIGAPVGASISSDIAAVQADTDDLQTRIPAALVSGRIDASVGAMAANTVTASAVATNAIDADALATDAVAEIADGLLNRDMSTGTDSGSTTVRTVRQALRFLRNKFSLSGTTLTIYKEDDSTSSWSSTVTTSASADPITGSDPA